MQNLVQEYNLITYVPNMDNFEHRLKYGLSAESVFDIACKDKNIIETAGFFSTQEVDPTDKKSKDKNAINGDRCFFHPRTLEIQFVDVKCTTFVSDHSMTMFRKDGWYLFNAFVESKGMQHFMIRNNIAFYEYAQQYSKIITRRNENPFKAYNINFKDLPADPKTIGLELYPYMDSSKFRQLILKIRAEYDNMGLPFAEIIKSRP